MPQFWLPNAKPTWLKGAMGCFSSLQGEEGGSNIVVSATWSMGMTSSSTPFLQAGGASKTACKGEKASTGAEHPCQSATSTNRLRMLLLYPTCDGILYLPVSDCSQLMFSV